MFRGFTGEGCDEAVNLIKSSETDGSRLASLLSLSHTHTVTQTSNVHVINRKFPVKLAFVNKTLNFTLMGLL